MKHNRILIFSTDDHLYPAGGAEQAMGNITERLQHIEFDLICARLRRGVKRYEKVKNVHIHRMGFGVPKLDGFILALFGHVLAEKLMRKHQYDLMWSIMASYGAFSAVRVKKKLHIPFLLTLQEGDSLDYIYRKVRLVRPFFNEIFRTADGIQAISQYLLRWGRDMGYRGNNGLVIPNGVSIEAFTERYSEDAKASARETFGFPSDAFILFTSSRLEVKNGIEDVVSALPLLPKNVCFLVCGSGSLDTKIKAQVQELGLENRVRFMGFVEPAKLPLLMQASDAFIRPSLSEGLGNAFLEAMAARIPVIGTNAGGIPDFLTHGKTGFVADIQSPESIALCVREVMSLSREERQSMLHRGESMVKERYNWDTIARDMNALFDTMTS